MFWWMTTLFHLFLSSQWRFKNEEDVWKIVKLRHDEKKGHGRKSL